MQSHKMLLIAEQIEPFTSSWGVVCKPAFSEDNNGYLLPLGWELELTERGVEFEEIEIVKASE